MSDYYFYNHSVIGYEEFIAMNSLKCRNYCFTLNNYKEEDIEKLLKSDVKYITFQKEVGDSGTPHLQGKNLISLPYMT